MKLFPGTETLEFVSIDILGELTRTKNGNIFLMVITDCFTKLTRTVPLKGITVKAVSQASVNHWMLVYGLPKTAISENGSKFMARFFTDMSHLIVSKYV